MCWCRPEIRTPCCGRIGCIPPAKPQATYAPIPGVFVIGLGHKARHGKDTAAGVLRDAFGAARFAFADDLYAYCRIVHRMIGKDAPLLQRVGVAMREDDPDVWIRSVYSKILAARPAVAVVTDVRFPNELDMIRAMGGEAWKVERRHADGSPFVDPSRPATHESETALDGAAWDRVIVNPDGDPWTFEWRIKMAYTVARRSAAA